MRKLIVSGSTLALTGLALCGPANLAARANGPTMTFNTTGTLVTFTGHSADAFGPTLQNAYDLTAHAGTNEISQYSVQSSLSPGTIIVKGKKTTKPGVDYFAFTTDSSTGGNYKFALQSNTPKAGLVLTAFDPWGNPMGAGQATQGTNPYSEILSVSPDTTYFVSVSQLASGKTYPSSVGYDLRITDAPEPDTWAAFTIAGLGTAGLMLRARKSRRTA